MPHLKKQVFSVNAEGHAEQIEVKVSINDHGLFTIPLPKHLRGFIHDQSIGNLSSTKLTEVINTYEVTCEKYSRWKLSSRMVPRIAVAGWLLEPDDMTHSASLSFERVLFDETSNTPYRTTADGLLAGAFTSSVPYRMIDDTPEVFAKLAELRDSLIVAGKLLDGINVTEDPAGYIMAIKTAASSAAVDESAPIKVADSSDQPELPFGNQETSPQPDDDVL